jgi:hypothetical protein
MSTDQQSSDILSNKSESMSILNSDSNISEQSNVILNPSVENKMDKSKPFHKLNILEILIQLKNTWFGILDDLFAGNYSMSILVKDNRMFYVGLTVLIFAIILYVYDYAIDDDPYKNLFNKSGGIVEIRHIYDKN